MATPIELPAPPVPWFTFEVQRALQWRAGDIVISVAAKSGTNWMMNIVHQLRSGGDDGFRDIYHHVPWLEFVPRPGATTEGLTAALDAMPAEPRRVFKTHSGPPLLPYLAPGTGPEVKYIVVGRNPEEVLVSLKPFFERHRAEWFELWGMEAGPPLPSFELFYEHVIGPMDSASRPFQNIAGWWAHRHQPNVLVLHFTDLLHDLEGSIRKVAAFAGLEPSPEQMPTIVERCSFAWMKANQIKFELPEIGAIPVLESGSLIRRGKVGEARDEGMTDAIAAQVAEAGRRALPDEAARRWLYEGGELP